jgi:hypothetical protein
MLIFLYFISFPFTVRLPLLKGRIDPLCSNAFMSCTGMIAAHHPIEVIGKA